jgi:hypothetical protein
MSAVSTSASVAQAASVFGDLSAALLGVEAARWSGPLVLCTYGDRSPSLGNDLSTVLSHLFLRDHSTMCPQVPGSQLDHWV